MKRKFRDGLEVGALYAGFGMLLGVVAAVGAAATLSLPFATAATVGMGVLGLAGTAFGAALSICAPHGADWRGSVVAGLAFTAAMTCGTYAALSPPPPAPPASNSPPVSMQFNGASPRTAAEAIALSRAPLFTLRSPAGPS
jgi:hypothetical protein